MNGEEIEMEMKEKVSLEKDDHKELPKWHYEVSGEVRV
jgi:hypothetical protein